MADLIKLGLGRDDKFLQGMEWHGSWIFSCATVINAMPPFLRPVVGAVVKLYGKRVRKVCMRPILPLVKSRLAAYVKHREDLDQVRDPPVRLVARSG